MKTIESFIFGLDGQQKAIVSFLHQFITQHFELTGKINWNIPTYYHRQLICYLNPLKEDGIELAFFQGSKLSNEQGILERKGRKLVAGIDLHDVNNIPEQEIHEIINEAIILDDLLKSK